MNLHRRLDLAAARPGAGALALGFLLLTSGCVTATRVPMADAQRAQIGSARTIGGLSQQELGVRVVASNSGAAVGGLVGALIDTAVTNSRAKAAEGAVVPVRDALVDYDAGSALGTALKKQLAPLGWLKRNTVEVRNVPDSDAARAELVTKSGADVVLLVQTGYRLTPTFDALEITAKVSLLPRVLAQPKPAEGEEASEPAGPKPLYFNRIVTSAPLPGFTPDKSLEDAAKLWAENRGKIARRALDGGMAELATMIAFDLEQAGPPADAKTYDAPPGAKEAKVVTDDAVGFANGFVIREAHGRTWVRLRTGELYSQGELYL